MSKENNNQSREILFLKKLQIVSSLLIIIVWKLFLKFLKLKYHWKTGIVCLGFEISNSSLWSDNPLHE